ncbi:hypothetical protein Francci3_0850 [Frankia casuarinae]|uniref:Transposase n=1 Tax=Frankia casuarinae (strain DSM 45818 / CECT 9043 / HFP020203 / CcI3) TaxID=106370 RepID=Q2JEQ8_FRACC|nr:hypothetical protein Francci3_0850 [Frankia casuarinae]
MKRTKARAKVARIHGRIRDRRRDHPHTPSTRIIRENQTVVEPWGHGEQGPRRRA